MECKTYTITQDWMLDLGLDIYETTIYAVIFGFSQDGESTFAGSIAYLCRKAMCSRSKVIRSLKSMSDNGLLQKIEITRNGVKFCEYRAVVPDTGGVCETPGGSVCGTPNNKDIENKDNNIYYDENGNLFAAKEAKPTNTMKSREEKFRSDCMSFVGEFGTQMVDEFVLYWTEPNKSKTAMKFEIQKTWDTHRRMLTWSRNNFHKYNRQEPTEERKEISGEEALRRAGWIQ